MFLRSKTVLVPTEKKSRSRGKATRRLDHVDVLVTDGPPADTSNRERGYKVTQFTSGYEEGKTYTLQSGPAVMNHRGFHFCRKAKDCLGSVNFRRGDVLWEIVARAINYSQRFLAGYEVSVTNEIYMERKLPVDEQDLELTGWTDVLDDRKSLTYYYKGLNAGGYCPHKRLAWSSTGSTRRDYSMDEAAGFLAYHITKVEEEVARGAKYLAPSGSTYGGWYSKVKSAACSYQTTITSAYRPNFVIGYGWRKESHHCTSIEEADARFAAYLAKRHTKEMEDNAA